MAGGRVTVITAKKAARYLRVSMLTLSRIEREGGLVPYRTPGGHRRYSVKMLNEYLSNSLHRFPGQLVNDDDERHENGVEGRKV
jgi:excisionase family DNA binding protein